MSLAHPLCNLPGITPARPTTPDHPPTLLQVGIANEDREKDRVALRAWAKVVDQIEDEATGHEVSVAGPPCHQLGSPTRR